MYWEEEVGAAISQSTIPRVEPGFQALVEDQGTQSHLRGKRFQRARARAEKALLLTPLAELPLLMGSTECLLCWHGWVRPVPLG